jgi:hypothetical protein
VAACGSGVARAPIRGVLSDDLVQRGRNNVGASLTTWTKRPMPMMGRDSRSEVKSDCGLRVGSKIKDLPPFKGLVNIPVRESPYSLTVFSRLLANHPSLGLRKHIEDGLSPAGFDFAYEGDRSEHVMAKNWGHLQYSHDVLVWEKMMKEVAQGTRYGPVYRPPFPNDSCPHQPQLVPTGTVVKDKWDPNPDPEEFRIVNDYSANGGQNKQRGEFEELDMTYYQVLHLIQMIILLGIGTIVILWDVKGAYRTLNAKESNWHLQVSWLLDKSGIRQFFVDLVNPFGRVESQRNWEAVAGAIEWIMHELGAVFVRHYVDNFHDFVRPGPLGPDWDIA